MRNIHTWLFSFLSFTFLTFVYLTIVGVDGYCCTWSHSMAQTHTNSVGLLWTKHRPFRRPLPDNIQHLRENDIHAPWRDWNQQSLRESGGRPTPTRPIIQYFRTWSDLNSVLSLTCRREFSVSEDASPHKAVTSVTKH